MTDTVDSPEVDTSNASLRAGVLGLFDSVIMGVAGVAPGYSIAASTAVLFGAVLLGGAAALLYCGIAMFGIVFAFSYLGRIEANAGASYSWVRRALHPVLGFMSGWALIVSALIFMVTATVPVGSTILSLFSTTASNNTAEVTLVGAVFFLLMVTAVAAGVTVTVVVQIVMSCIELLLLVLFAALAIFHGHHVHNFSWHWFSPSVFHGQAGDVYKRQLQYRAREFEAVHLEGLKDLVDLLAVERALDESQHVARFGVGLLEGNAVPALDHGLAGRTEPHGEATTSDLGDRGDGHREQSRSCLLYTSRCV